MAIAIPAPAVIGKQTRTRAPSTSREALLRNPAPSVDLVVRRGLESGVSAEALRDQSCPSTLLDAGRAAVDKAVREGHAGVLAPLPMFVEDARTASKRRAVHAVRDSVAQWLGSSEAADWRRDRRALFPCAAGPALAE